MLSDRDGSGLELGDVTVDKGSSAAVASIASGRGILCRPSHTTDGISAIASSGNGRSGVSYARSRGTLRRVQISGRVHCEPRRGSHLLSLMSPWRVALTPPELSIEPPERATAGTGRTRRGTRTRRTDETRIRPHEHLTRAHTRTRGLASNISHCLRFHRCVMLMMQLLAHEIWCL